MATLLGVSPRTYAYYEQGQRLPDADALARLVADGWNANWLLTGEGPERLDALGTAESQFPPGSQEMSPDVLRMCIQAVDEELQAAGRTLDATKRALAYTLTYEITIEARQSLPTAKIVQMAVRAAAA